MLKTLKFAVVCVLAMGILVGISACKKPQPAVISGTVVVTSTPGAALDGMTVTAVAGGADKASSPVSAQTGEFSITLPEPGTYDLRLTTPVKSVDFTFAIEAKAGETVTAPNIEVPADALPAPAPAPEPAPATPAPAPAPAPATPAAQ